MRKICHVLFIAFLMGPFIFILSSTSAQEKKEAEEVYTIKSGDTLWDISSKFLKDPSLWPKLWQRNPSITNPHWIYPGNTIRLSPIEEVKEVKEEPKKVEVERRPAEEVKKVEAPPAEKKREEVVGTKPGEEKPPVFPEARSAGFISDINFKGIGVILQNKESKTLMAEGDIVYLSFKTSDPILTGNKYTIFRPSDEVTHPTTGKKVGRKFNITGNLQIIDQSGSFYTAKIIEAFETILVGDLVKHYVKEKMEVQEGKK
jgi:hypothetical protein